MDNQTLGSGMINRTWPTYDQGQQDQASVEQTFENLFSAFFTRRYPNLQNWRQIDQSEFQNLIDLCTAITPYVVEARQRLNQQTQRVDGQRTQTRAA